MESVRIECWKKDGRIDNGRGNEDTDGETKKKIRKAKEIFFS